MRLLRKIKKFFCLHKHLFFLNRSVAKCKHCENMIAFDQLDQEGKIHFKLLYNQFVLNEEEKENKFTFDDMLR